jgi:hypothetical protein
MIVLYTLYNYEFANQTLNMMETEVFAKFDPSEDMGHT